jgi:hypothetical protein
MVSLEYLIGIILPAALWPGVVSASERSEYQEYFLGVKGAWCVGLSNVPPSCANCIEIWELQPPGSLRACNRLYLLLCFNCIEKINSSLVNAVTTRTLSF